MATTVDERIVAAKFDASDFEKGVDKTVKKLDELKKSLEFTEATKSVKELAEKTESSTNSLSNSLEKLTNRFTTFTGMIKQKILGGLADEVANVFLRMEQSVKSFIKSISTDQVGAGMDKYQQMLTSVRIMVSAGRGVEESYEALERIQAYTDETSYSLSQMTDAMSKMVAAGVKLDVAEKNVEGIANACANAGINAQDASRAFYNLSQAYSSGRLHYTDYRSLEMMNLTTSEFKEQMLEAAVAAETLEKKVDKSGKVIYKTVNKKDKKVKAGKEVNTMNLSDSLKYDFMNTDAMNYLFGSTYWMQEIDKGEIARLRKELGDEEFERRFGKIASTAYAAAREARSFTDVINTLKDAVSTGWSKTFEHIFGRLEEAKDFFTALTEGELADAIYRIGEWRNAVLDAWNPLTSEGEGAGGRMLRQSILNITDALGTFLKTIMSIITGFDELDNSEEEGQHGISKLGNRLLLLTAQFRDTTKSIKKTAEQFNKWMNSPIMQGETTTRIEAIRKVFANLAAGLTIARRVIRLVFSSITKALETLSPVFDGFVLLLEKVTEPLVGLGQNTDIFKDLQHSVENVLTVLGPVAKVLKDILSFLGDVGAFIVQFGIDSLAMNIEFVADAIGLVMEVFTGNSAQLADGEGVLAGIRQDFEGIRLACTEGLGAVKQFFKALIEDIRKLFGLTDQAEEDAENNEGGIFSGIVKFFDTNEFVKKAKAWINQAIIDIGDFIKSIPARIVAFGANVYDSIYHMIFEDVNEVTEDGTEQTQAILTPFGKWLNNLIIDIKDFVVSIPGKIVEGVGKLTNWIDIVFDYITGNTNESEGGMNNLLKTNVYGGKQQEKLNKFNQFITSVIESIKDWFTDLPNKIRKAMKGIGNFFSVLWDKLDEFLFGKKSYNQEFSKGKNGKPQIKMVVTRIKSGFSLWLDNIINEVKKFISNIPAYLKSGIKGAGDVITTIINTIFGRDNANPPSGKDIEDGIKKPFLDINLEAVGNVIRDIGKEILNQILRIFTGSEDISFNLSWLSDKVANGIYWIKDKVQIALDWLVKNFPSIPSKIIGFFTGENKEKQESGPIGKAIHDFGETISGFITELPGMVAKLVQQAIIDFDNLWTDIYNAIIGQVEDTPEEAAAELTDSSEKSKWDEFVEKLGNLIKTALTYLPTWIAQGIELAVAGIKKLFDKATEWLEGANLAEELAEAAKDEVTDTANGDWVTDGSEEQTENHFLDAVKRIGAVLYKLITTTIPAFIRAAWTWLGTKAANIWAGISAIFSGNPNDDETGNIITSIYEKVKDFIVNKLPAKLANLWSEISSLGVDVYAGIKNAFTGEIPANERQEAITNVINNIRAFIDDAVKAVADLLSGKNEWKTNIVRADMYNEVVAAVEKQQSQANARLTQENKDGEGWSFVDSIKNGLLKALESIGPFLLNTLSDVLDWLGSIVTIVIDAITGDKPLDEQVEAAYGKEETPLKNALKKIGESLKKFFLESLPELIGSVIGFISAKAPEWFGKVFSAFTKASNAASQDAEQQVSEDAKNPEEKAKGMLERITEFLGGLMQAFTFEKATDIAAIIGVIVAITLLLDKLGDMFSASRVTENAAELAKWGAMAIAFAAIGSLISSITNLYNSGETEKIKQFETFLDKIGSLAEKAIWIVGLLAAPKIAGSIEGVSENMKAIKSMDFENMYSGSITNVTTYQLDGSKSGNLMSALTQFLGPAFAGLGVDFFAKFSSAGIDTFISTVTDSIAELSIAVNDIMGQIEPFIKRLVDSEASIEKGIEVANKLYDLFVALFNSFNGLYEVIGAESAEDSAKTIKSKQLTDNDYGEKELYTVASFMTSLEKRAAMLVELSIFMEKMLDVLNKIENVDELKKKISDATELFYGDDFGQSEFTTFLTSLFDAVNTALYNSSMRDSFSAMADYTGIQAYTDNVSIMLEVLGSALSAFTIAISGIDEADIETFDRTLDVFVRLADAINGRSFDQSSLSKAFFGNSTLAKLGTQLSHFGERVKKFYEAVKTIPGFKSNEVEETTAKIDSILKVVTQFIFAGAQAVSHLVEFEYLTEIVNKMPDYAKQFGLFITNLNDGIGDISLERSQILVNTIVATTSIIEALANMYSSMPAFDGASWLNDAITALSYDDNISKLISLVTTINKAFVKVMETDEFKEGTKETGAVFAKMLVESIQYALDNDDSLRPKVRVIIDTEDMRSQIRTFSMDPSTQATVPEQSINAPVGNLNYQTEARINPADLYAKIDAIAAAVKNGPDNALTAGDVIQAFGGMKMVLNTGALVGSLSDSIDEKIGEKIWILSRGGSVSGIWASNLM